MKNTGRPKIVVICGPTASGKSRVAIALARSFNAEIVSADSGQVYQGFDIGTAKPTVTECCGVPYHMIDVVPPDQQFDAAQFRALADETIRQIDRRGRPVFVVGGTGLYLRALLGGLFPGVGRDEKYRKKLRALAKNEGVEALHRLLQQRDPVAAARIRPTDPARLERALEVIYLTGQSIVAHQRAHDFDDHPFHSLEIGLAVGRTTLYRRIDERTLEMMKAGWLDEVARLRDLWGEDIPGFGLIGYRELLEHLQGQRNLEDSVTLIQQKTRNYAKRQLTWFRREPEILWFLPRALRNIRHEIQMFLD